MNRVTISPRGKTSVSLAALLLASCVLLGAYPAQAASSARGVDPRPGSHASERGRWMPHTVIVKFTPASMSFFSSSSAAPPSAAEAYTRYGVYETVRMYPRARNAFTESGREIGIDRMYRLAYASNADPWEVARALSRLPEVEYAEPERIHSIVYTPNDAMLGQQYALDAMRVKTAWDTTTGTASVVIGIVDSGVHWTHEDLRENVFINAGEDANHDGRFTTADLNGVDDDGNGYVDDIIGIDFVGPTATGGGAYYDNNPLPTPTGNNHGTHVAGIAAAIGNNGKGIAGVAFRCRYLPVKCSPDDGGNNIIRGYDGIVYAADMGATVINCSWGGPGGYLQSEIDRIEYALAKGAVVVAAAGNEGRDEIFTPAAYPNVLSVASTGPDDRVSSFSNYSTWVDVSAPGEGIISTLSASNSSYGAQSGTSMAAPNCSGVVALVASHRPELRGRALAEQVRVSADNIDSLQPRRYERKIGYGRVNAARALTVFLPSVRMVSSVVSDRNTGNGDGIFDRGETLEITMEWKNFLAPTKNAVVTLQSKSPNVTILAGEYRLGSLPTGASIDNGSSPFVIRLADVESYNEQIDIFFRIADEGYDDYGGISFIWQQTYRDHNANDITMTVSNDGNIGFDDFSGVRGKGFIYRNNGANVLFEGALMIGATVGDSPIVVDVARNETGNVQCTDFAGAAPVLMRTPGLIAAQEGMTEFTDDNAPLGSRLGVRVRLHSWAFTDPGLENVIILAYTIHNTSAIPFADLHAALFFDWDIGPSASSDYSDFDSASQTSWAYDFNKQVPTYVGATVLTRGKPVHFMSIANPESDANPPVFGIHNGFTKQEKWRSMSSGVWNTRVLFTDISQVIGNGPYALQPGDSCTVAFALIAGYRKSDILEAVPRALEKWRELSTQTRVHPLSTVPARIEILAIAPHPLRSSSTVPALIRIASPNAGPLALVVTDLLGRTVRSSTVRIPAPGDIAVPFEPFNLPPGTYVLHAVTPGGWTTRLFRVL
ncbi:MAG: S8 family serine peptidase [Bacteroidota bacterium]|nr:S8 family serine peptidase [Bacteroidota bacterium]